MIEFIFQTAVVVSLGAVLFLLARALPRVENAETRQHTPDFIEKLLSRIPMDQLDSRFNGFLEKSLRKTRVVLSKADTIVKGSLERVKMHEKRREKPTLASADFFPNTALPPSPEGQAPELAAPEKIAELESGEKEKKS